MDKVYCNYHSVIALGIVGAISIGSDVAIVSDIVGGFSIATMNVFALQNRSFYGCVLSYLAYE